MKAVALVPGSTTVRIVDRPEPSITAADEVKIRVRRVGICGTDREQASGGRARAPDGRDELVIGHEMLGEVVEVGDDVTRVQPGDHAVLTVRRGCGRCLPCGMNRSDMCRTGGYRERGIWGEDGFLADYVVDREAHVVRVPPEVEAIGVLTEPLSVVEKAIDEVVRIQFTRLPAAGATPDWLFGRRCLIAGLGPVGLLAALILRLRGAEVCGMDVVDPASARPRWLEGIGGRYVDGREFPPDRLREETGPMDLLFEAAGAPRLAFNLLELLGLNGIYIVTGIPGGDRDLPIPAAQLLRDLVLDNQLMMGSVNAARGHFQLAVDDLVCAYDRWGEHVARLITHRYSPEEIGRALHEHPEDEIKAVVEWGEERFVHAPEPATATWTRNRGQRWASRSVGGGGRSPRATSPGGATARSRRWRATRRSAS